MRTYIVITLATSIAIFSTISIGSTVEPAYAFEMPKKPSIKIRVKIPDKLPTVDRVVPKPKIFKDAIYKIPNPTPVKVDIANKILPSGVQNMGKTIETVVQDFGKTLEKAVQDIGKTLEKSAHDTGRALEKAAQDTGKFLYKPIQMIKDFFTNIADKLARVAGQFMNWMAVTVAAVLMLTLFIGASIANLFRRRVRA